MSGYNNSGGSFNVFVGNKAGLLSNSNSNIFIGNEVGYLSTGSSNVFIGVKAGRNNSIGGRNVFIGFNSAISNTIGSNNVFVGDFSGENNIDGDGNVFIGKDSGKQNQEGDNNVFVGYNSGFSGTRGQRNVFVGVGAGYSNNEFDNIMIGTFSGYTNNGWRNVFIGRMAGYNAKGNRKLYIEDSDADSTGTLIFGDFDQDWLRVNNALGIGRNPEANALEVEGNASKTTSGSWLANSDRRIKTDIHQIENAKEILLQLNPVKFKYTEYWKSKHPSIEDIYYYNFIAQEYQVVFPESVKGSGEYLDGDNKEILQLDSYNAQIVTIQAVKDLIIENIEQKEKINQLEQRIAELESLKAEIEAIKLIISK
jgi:hypothetical protein